MATWIRAGIAALIVLALAGSKTPSASAVSYIEITVPTQPVELASGAGGMWYTTGNHVVGVVHPDLTVEEFATTGYAIDIAAGPDGNMWFTEVIYDEYVNHGLIGRVTPAGTVTEFTIPTDNSDPDGITAGPDGNLWFSENDAAKIGRITPDGVFTEYPLPNLLLRPAGIAAGPDGNLWFVDHDFSHVGRMTPAGVTTLFKTPTRFSNPNNITAGPDGNMWFTENDAVASVTPDGSITEYPITTNWYAWDIVSLRSSLVFTEPGSQEIGRIWPGGRRHESLVPGALGQPWAIAVSPAGDLWLTENIDNQIAIISP